jgi:cytidine deaminase
MVGVTTGENAIKFISLSKLQPYHWTTAIPIDELENYDYFQREK